MAYGSVHIPAGCTVKVGDTVPGLVDLGVLKGDAQIVIAYDKVKVLGNKAEVLLDFVKNMKATATFEMYQLYLPNIAKLLDGVATLTAIAGVLVAGAVQVVANGSWGYNDFILIEHQNGSGAAITVRKFRSTIL